MDAVSTEVDLKLCRQSGVEDGLAVVMDTARIHICPLYESLHCRRVDYCQVDGGPLRYKQGKLMSIYATFHNEPPSAPEYYGQSS